MNPDYKVHGANMGPTWVLSAPDGPHIGPRNLALSEGSLIASSWNFASLSHIAHTAIGGLVMPSEEGAVVLAQYSRNIPGPTR